MTKILKKTVLLSGELLFKATALGVMPLTAASKGNTLEKVIGGYQKLPRITSLPQETYDLILKSKEVLDDLNTIPVTNFISKYASSALHNTLEHTNLAFNYMDNMYNNVVEQPLETSIAVLTSGLIAYSIARGLKFVRQEGQGSYLQKLERKIGNNLFKK